MMPRLFSCSHGCCGPCLVNILRSERPNCHICRSLIDTVPKLNRELIRAFPILYDDTTTATESLIVSLIDNVRATHSIANNHRETDYPYQSTSYSLYHYDGGSAPSPPYAPAHPSPDAQPQISVLDRDDIITNARIEYESLTYVDGSDIGETRRWINTIGEAALNGREFKDLYEGRGMWFTRPNMDIPNKHLINDSFGHLQNGWSFAPFLSTPPLLTTTALVKLGQRSYVECTASDPFCSTIRAIETQVSRLDLNGWSFRSEYANRGHISVHPTIGLYVSPAITLPTTPISFETKRITVAARGIYNKDYLFGIRWFIMSIADP